MTTTMASKLALAQWQLIRLPAAKSPLVVARAAPNCNRRAGTDAAPLALAAGPVCGQSHSWQAARFLRGRKTARF